MGELQKLNFKLWMGQFGRFRQKSQTHFISEISEQISAPRVFANFVKPSKIPLYPRKESKYLCSHRLNKKSPASLKFIDLFSGCGGFSAGLEMAGHRCLLGVDIDAHAIESFKLNHPHGKGYCGDIGDLTKGELKSLINPDEVDMIVGGPPCQGFSTVGRGQVNDRRNQLFRHFVRIVGICRPKVIIMENVVGLLASKNRETLNAIFKEFEKLGYSMEGRVLSSEEYGVPEIRRRTIMIGTLGPLVPLFPEITHGPRSKGRKKVRTLGHALRNLEKALPHVANHDPKMAQIKNELDRKRIKYVPEGKGIRYERDERAYLPKRLQFEFDWEELPEKRLRQTKYYRLDRKKPAPTILTSRIAYYHPTESRYLTPREAAACQSFPNHFKFHGPQTSQFRQIGNAVPPLLAQALGIAARQMIHGKNAEKLKGKKRSEFFKYAFNYNKKVPLSDSPSSVDC